MRHAYLFILALCISTTALAQKKPAFGTNDYIRAMKHITDVMVNDVTNPVAASRYYAYISIAANETARQFNPQQPVPGGQLNYYTPAQLPAGTSANCDESFATVLTIYKAGVRFLPSGYLLKSKVDSLSAFAEKRKISKEKIAASSGMVDIVVQAAASYAAADGFSKLSGLRRFTPTTGDEFWQPTSPGFMSAVEPYWATLRPFVIDSASQFKIIPPHAYNTDSTSVFYKEMMEVYNITANLTAEQHAIAMFWDCNPFNLQQVGHLEFGIKKITPGGHWVGIAGIACKKTKTSLSKTAYVHALLSTTLADAFITCWNTKYRFNRIRPETAIKRLVNKNWMPLLQTPPFPEYTSGHSVISAACAGILTAVFGDNFAFADDTETEFDLPVRKYKSFNAAAKEAAISRLYGGIHFRDAIENGQKEGEQVARYILTKGPKFVLK